jgi:hypothetical protein
VDVLVELTTRGLADVVGGGEQPAKPGLGARGWQHVKDFTGGFLAGAYSGETADQPWGNSSSQTSKLGGEVGVMSTLGMGTRLPRRR